MSTEPSDVVVPRDHRSSDRLLLDASRRGGSSLAVLAGLALAMAVAETALPALLGKAVDGVAAGAPPTWVLWCALAVAVVVVTDIADDVVTGTTTARCTAWLRHSLLRKVLTLGPNSARCNAGDLSGRIVANASAAGRAAPDVVRTVANLIPSVGGIVALALIDPWLCATFLAGLPLLLFLLRTFLREASAMADGYLEAQAGIAGRLVDALSGARTIAAAGTTDREVRRVLGPLPQLQRFGMGMWRSQVRLTAQDALVLPLLEVMVLAVAGFRLASGALTPGQLLAAGQYVQLAAGIGSAAGAATRLARARAGAARVADILGETAPAYGPWAAPDGKGCLEFSHVTVRKGDRAVLDDVSLTVPPGALVAVVGRSGSGKSLLAALAGRLLDPDEGDVLLDGSPLRELGWDALRTEITYGFERPALIGETVGDTIAFGATTPSREEMVAAACAARADDFIRHLPAGYETPMAETPLSGGEAQRMGLARTFAHAGRLVVLDDVAASLDTVTEHQIGRVLTGRLGGRTRLVIAQRASTAARADLVVWLDGGRVRAMQPHLLLWADSEYRAVFGPSDPRVVDDEGDRGAGTAEEESADVIRGAEEPADAIRGAEEPADVTRGAA